MIFIIHQFQNKYIINTLYKLKNYNIMIQPNQKHNSIINLIVKFNFIKFTKFTKCIIILYNIFTVKNKIQNYL